jgi:hypothetical protein
MSGKDLFEGMGYVDERFVDEAENKTLPKRIVSPWIKVASMAACLCLIIFSLYNLQPYLRGETEGMAGQEAADAMPEGVLEDKVDHESEIVIPAEGSAGEVPSVILYVEDMTDLGFIGTVAQLVDTDIFEIGMKLNVVVADGTRHETADGNPSMSADSKTDYSGSYVLVQFIEYDRKTGTIIVDIIQEADTPETTP